MSRRLFKRVLRLGLNDLEDKLGRRLAGMIALPEEPPPADQVANAESEIAKAVGLEPHWVSLKWEEYENPLASRQSLKIEDKEIVLVDNKGRSRPFLEVSEIFENAVRSSRPYVSVFARPAGDGFSKEEVRKISEATFSALEIIGKAALEL